MRHVDPYRAGINPSAKNNTASQQIDAIIKKSGDWRGKKLFNTRLDSKTVRAIDFHEDDAINESALKALVLEVVRVNKKAHKRESITRRKL